MTLVGIAFLALRMFSVFLFYLGITHLSRFYYLGLTSLQVAELELNFTAMLLVHVIPASIILGMGVVLWIYAAKFSLLFIPQDSTENSQNDMQCKITYNVAISLVGLFIVIFSAANLCRELPQYILHITYTNSPLNMQYLFNTLAEVIKLILGLFLIIKANVIRDVLEFIQKRQPEV